MHTSFRRVSITAKAAALLSLTLISGCISPEGFRKRTWSKAELVNWYAEYRPTNDRLKYFGYRGSDEKYHYFITRPIDSFFMPRVPRTELQLSDVRPLSRRSGGPMYHYVVDPRHDFRKTNQP